MLTLCAEGVKKANETRKHLLFDCESLTNTRLRCFYQCFIQPHEVCVVSLRNLATFIKVLRFL